MPERELESAITLFLTGQPELEAAHWELYPERLDENIPLSLTLLYPFAPPAEIGAHVDALTSFFAERPPPAFDLVRLAEFPGSGIYAVPEPDGELRSTMRALWARFPEYPPYDRPGSDPPPHASLGRFAADPDPDTLVARAEARVGPLLPASFLVREATLMEMHELDRWQVRATFPFAE
jgi:2'-5' RNA ligase superfamily protein